MARTYKRDSRGRFAGGGGSSGGRPAARSAPRGKNRLTRDNSGRITSVGGDGATARGGRLRTAAGKQRAVRTAKIKGAPASVVSRAGKLKSGSKKRISLKPNVSFAAMERRLAGLSKLPDRRQRMEITRDEMAYRAGQYPKSKQKRQDYFSRASQAERNRTLNTQMVAARAADFYKGAIHSASNYGSRSRYGTGRRTIGAPPQQTFASGSAWRGYSYRPSRSRR